MREDTLTDGRASRSWSRFRSKPRSTPGEVSGFSTHEDGFDPRTRHMPFKSKEKRTQAGTNWARKNSEKVRAKIRERRAAIRAELNRIKEERGCADCKQKFPYYVLDFDHIDSSNKVNGVSALLKEAGLERVREEVQKCEVVCANCHRIRTHKRQFG